MRKIGLLLIAVAMTVATASAQRMIGAMPKEFLLLNPKVQAELAITKDQKAKIDDAVKDAVSDDGNGRIRIQMSPHTNMDGIVSDLKKAITPAQHKRLGEVWLQRDGAIALNDKDIAKGLGLTADQNKKVDSIMEDLGQAMQELIMSSGGKVGPEDSKRVRDKAKKELEAVMTADQKKKFEAMKGKPFKWS